MIILAYLTHVGDEERYIQVRSIDSLDVHLFLWDQDNMSLCGALVFEVLASGGPSAFFVNSGLNENSVGKIWVWRVSVSWLKS